MRIGVIAVGRDCADVMDAVLAPWLEAMGRHDIHMCLLTATFKDMGLPPKPDDATRVKMERYATKYHDRISSVAFDQEATEAEVRDKGREVLMARDKRVDLIWLLDLSDEYYTIQQIDRIITFVERNSLMCWYRLSLKNYIHDDKTYLVQPFQPPRIWWVRYGDRVLSRVTYDNDCEYANKDGSKPVADTTLPCLTIPPNLAWVRHHSWLNDERSRRKIVYQETRWNPPHGNGCSYAWDDVNKRVIFNASYYERTRQALPEVRREE